MAEGPAVAWGAAPCSNPGIYRMDLPTDLDTIVRGIMPVVVLGLYGAWHLDTAETSGGRGDSLTLLPASVVGVSVAFPYFYEPLLIERWTSSGSAMSWAASRAAGLGRGWGRSSWPS